MFVITCSTCRQRHLVGSRSIEVFVNTIDGPVATVRCPAGHEVHHHFRFPADDPRLLSTPPIMAHLEAGDLMLWDSRTVHCSSPGIEPAAPVDAAKPSLIRAASLVCMMPKSSASDEVIAQRRAAVTTQTSTTNWTDRFISTDTYIEMQRAENLDRFHLPSAPQLTEAQLDLVG